MPWAVKGQALRLSTRIVISQLAVLLLVVAFASWLNFRIARGQLNQQYEQRALAVAQTVANIPQTVAALSGTGPSSVIQPITLRISHSTGAAFVVVVNRGGIRLSSPDPALVGKWFHERVVSLDGQDHLRIDPGKPAPSANARAPVFGASGRVIGEVSVGFLEHQVSAGAWGGLSSAAAAAGCALLLGVAASLLLARRLKHITFGLELDEIARRLRKAEQLAAEQASLRRVATLVAVGVPQEDLFAAVAEEVGRLADADTAQVYQYQPDDSIVRVASWGRGREDLPLGATYRTGGHNVPTLVLETGRPARIDDAATVTGDPAPLAAQLNLHSVVGSPIAVDGHLCCLITVSTTRPKRMAEDAEQRIAAFTELAAIAIANAQAHADLAASRMRVVTAADEARRRIERNLHDGIQQRLVTLSLELRAIHDASPQLPDLDLRGRLSGVLEGMVSLLEELREITRGVHPAILSQAGLGPALKSLARRAALPVELNVQVPGRLPEPVEVAAYYVVSETLANAAKHSGASAVEVAVTIDGGVLRVCMRDDGCGGADPARGSGIVGLRDRAEALGGRMTLSSPPGKGTSIVVEIPLSQPPTDTPVASVGPAPPSGC